MSGDVQAVPGVCRMVSGTSLKAHRLLGWGWQGAGTPQHRAGCFTPSQTVACCKRQRRQAVPCSEHPPPAPKQMGLHLQR